MLERVRRARKDQRGECDNGGISRVNSKEFVEQLVEEMERLFAQLGETETLESESDGQVDVVTLLRLALKSELEASELAGFWMPTTPEVDAKMCLALQCGDEMKHYGLISERLAELGEDLTGFDPLADGHSPLYQYLRGLRTTVERIAGGPFASEAIAQVRNRQFVAFCRSVGRRARPPSSTSDVIQPEEAHHHQLGREILEKYATTAELQELAAGRHAQHAGHRRRAAQPGRQDDRRPQHPGVLTRAPRDSRTMPAPEILGRSKHRRARRRHHGPRHRPRRRRWPASPPTSTTPTPAALGAGRRGDPPQPRQGRRAEEGRPPKPPRPRAARLHLSDRPAGGGRRGRPGDRGGAGGHGAQGRDLPRGRPPRPARTPSSPRNTSALSITEMAGRLRPPASASPACTSSTPST